MKKTNDKNLGTKYSRSDDPVSRKDETRETNRVVFQTLKRYQRFATGGLIFGALLFSLGIWLRGRSLPAGYAAVCILVASLILAFSVMFFLSIRKQRRILQPGVED